MRALVLSLLVLTLLLLGFQVVTEYVAATRGVHGRSMSPTLRPGDRVVVDVWSYRHRSPREGEVVVLLGPLPGSAPLIKRCAPAPPGGRLRPETSRWPAGANTTAGGWWLLGDNPVDSWDSRAFGSVPRERIVGRVTWRYWPPSRVGPVE